MKLELKHLAGYLPYGLKLHDIYINATYKTAMNCEMLDYLTNSNNECVKPILHPLSDLTKEIEHNGEKFVPLEVLNNMLFTKHSYLEYYSSEHCNGAILFSTKISGFNILSMNEKIQKLCEWHFDLHNLIEKNLAIDINTLEK